MVESPEGQNSYGVLNVFAGVVELAGEGAVAGRSLLLLRNDGARNLGCNVASCL